MAEQPYVRLPGTHKPGQLDGRGIGILIFGQTGVGKTTLLSTVPGMGIVIDVPQIEGGDLVLKPWEDRIEVRSISRWGELDEIYQFLLKEHHPYKWVAVDTMTALMELATRRTVREREINADPHILSQPEWQKITGYMGDVIFRFRNLPIHSVFLAQEKRRQDTGRTGPDVTPAVLQKLLQPQIVCGRLFTDMTDQGILEYKLRIGTHPNYETKCRALPSLHVPNIIRNPNLDTLVHYLATGENPPEEAPETDFWAPLTLSTT